MPIVNNRMVMDCFNQLFALSKKEDGFAMHLFFIPLSAKEYRYLGWVQNTSGLFVL